MEFRIENNKYYLDDKELDKVLSFKLEANSENYKKLTIEVIVDDVSIDSIVSNKLFNL